MQTDADGPARKKSSNNVSNTQKVELAVLAAKIDAQKEIVSHVQSLVSQMGNSMSLFMNRLGLILAAAGLATGLIGGWQLYLNNQRITEVINDVKQGEKDRTQRFAELTKTLNVYTVSTTNKQAGTDYIYAEPNITAITSSDRPLYANLVLNFTLKVTFTGSTTAKLNSLQVGVNRTFVDTFFTHLTTSAKNLWDSDSIISAESLTMVSGAPAAQSFTISQPIPTCEKAKELIRELILLDNIGEVTVTPIFEVTEQPKTSQTFKVKLIDMQMQYDCNVLMGTQNKDEDNRGMSPKIE